MTDNFKALRVYTGKKVQSRVENLSLEALSAGEVLIKVAYSSVNYKDALAITGAGKIIREFPRVAGIDAAGCVITSEDERFKAGDEVLVTGYELGTGHDGGYAEYARVPGKWIVPLPEDMSLKTAMILGTAGFTVALAVQRLEANGQTPAQGPLVVTGATGGVGSLAIDILAKLGYQVVAVSGKAEAEDYLLSLGASQVLNRHEIALSGPPLGKGQWGGAIDNVGGDVLAWLLSTTKPWGNIVAVGLAGGSHLDATVMPFILRGVSVLGVTSASCPAALRSKLWHRLATDLAPRHLDKILSRVVTLDELPTVAQSLLQGTSKGRILVNLVGDK